MPFFPNRRQDLMSGDAKKEESAIVQYGSFDLGDLDEVEKDLPEGGAGGFFKMLEGKNVLRFIPPRQGQKGVYTWYKHYFEAGGERSAIVCVKMQCQEPCPICAKGSKMKSSGNRIDAKRARGFEPRAYVYANIVDMKNPEKGAQIANFSPGLFKEIRAQIDASDVGKLFAHPEKGFNIIITRKGMGRNDTTYKVTVARESSELANAMEFITTQADLTTVEEMPDDDRLEEALDGEFEEKGKRGGGKKKKEKKDDDDEEDAEFEDI